MFSADHPAQFCAQRGFVMKRTTSCLLALLALSTTLVHAQQRKFNHVVIIVQENRTVDNLFGSNPTFEPGVDIATSGLNSLGQQIPLTPVALASCYDLNHAHVAFEQMYDNGKMDGADKIRVGASETCQVPANPQFKFVDNSKGILDPYFLLASQYGFANRMFQTNQGPSFPAHQFLISGTSAPSTFSNLFAAENPSTINTAGCLAPATETVTLIDPKGKETSKIYPCFEHPTMTDLLDDATPAIGWKYYTPSAGSIWTAPNAIAHMCVPRVQGGNLVCAGRPWVDHVVIPQSNVLTDIQNCRLPPVSWIIPDGTASDHARTNKGLGPAWVASIVNAIGTANHCGKFGYWRDTAILITWDDWGGWYDHVPPYRIGQPGGWGSGYVYGFRVPLLVVSAYTPTGFVSNDPHDFGSILNFLETNFAQKGIPLGPIGPGTYADVYAKDLLTFFTLQTPRQFHNIPASHAAEFFLNQTGPPVPPDDDGDDD
jgi:phospholipase C